VNESNPDYDPASLFEPGKKDRPTKDPSVDLAGRGLYPAPFIWLFVVASLTTFGLCALVLLRSNEPYDGSTAYFGDTRPVWVKRIIGSGALATIEDKSSELTIQRYSLLLSLTIGALTLYSVVGTIFELPVIFALSREFADVVNCFPDSLFGTVMFVGGAVIFVGVLVCCALAVSSLAAELWRMSKQGTHSEARDPDPAGSSAVSGGWMRRVLHVLALPVGNSIIFGILGLLYCMSFAFATFSNDQASPVLRPSLFLFLRSTSLGSGVSPVVPVLLVGIAALALLVSSLRRIAFLEENWNATSSLSFGHKCASFAGVAEIETRVRKLLKSRPGDLPTAMPFLAVGAIGFLWFMAMRPGHSFEGVVFDWFLSFEAFAVFVAVTWALVRLVLVWGATRELLRRVYRHPNRAAFDAVHRQLPGGQRIMLTETTLPLMALESSLGYAREMVLVAKSGRYGSAAGATPHQGVTRLNALENELRAAEVLVSATLAAEAGRRWKQAVASRAQAEQAIGKLTEGIAEILEPQWRTQSAGGESAFTDPVGHRVYRLGELFIAERVIDFLRGVFPHFKNLMTGTTVAILLTLLAMNSYPFEQRDTLLTIAWLAVLSAVSVMGYVLVTMNRDRVLSLLAGTEPGKLTWNGTLIAQFLTYTILPLLGLLGVQFPGQMGALFSWLSRLGTSRPA
jgi:hypothetical protein